MDAPAARRSLLCFFLAVSLPCASLAATFTVTNTTDSGAGSLRQALLDANAAAGKDLIAFSIAGGGVHTISPNFALPTITDSITIDARTQPGYAGTPLIELSGANAGAGVDGLHVTAGNSEIYGLAINRFQSVFLGGGGNGIVLETGGGNLVRYCFIGTNPSGTAGLGNFAAGVLILNSSNDQIGVFTGPPPIGFDNVISSNSTGVLVSGSSSTNTIAQNAIGTSPAGTADLGNFADGVNIQGGTGNQINFNRIVANNANGVAVGPGATGTVIGFNGIGDASLGNGSDGVEISGSSGNTITNNVVVANAANGILLFSGGGNNLVQSNTVGGSSGLGNGLNGIIASGSNGNTIAGNRVIGNGTNGIRIRSGASGNLVRGNFVGVAAGGGGATPNLADGIQINDGAVNNIIGGTAAGDENVSSGNLGNGVRITDAATMGNILQGNRIGTREDGSTPQPNLGHGVLIENDATTNTVGGTSPGAGNLITFNTAAGIFVSTGTSNQILGNSIRTNGSLGIDLAPAGVTPNDPDDSDTGPNNLQNFPVLASASSAGSMTNVQGSLSSAVTTNYRIEFFASNACDSSGNGEGAFFLGSANVLTDSGGIALIDATLPVPAPGAWITATATDPSGNTSEFSACVMLPGPALVSVTPTSGPAAGGTNLNLTGVRFQNGATVSVGGVAAGSPAVQDDMHATAVSPALAPGALYDVTLTNLDGLSATLPKAWLADFSDVPGAHPFHNFIEKLIRHAVTAGCTPGNFCPSDPVTRAQVAVFLLRSHDGPTYVPPAATGTVFADVPAGSFAAAWIEELARRAITAGCGGGNYCPQASVTREQMAVFILRTEHGPTYVPPNAVGLFGDVPVSSPFARWIEQLANEGITGGCGGGNFCPHNATTRGQMAVFLVVAFGLM